MIVCDLEQDIPFLKALSKCHPFENSLRAALESHPFPGKYVTDYIGVSMCDKGPIESVALYLHDPETMPIGEMKSQRQTVLDAFKKLLPETSDLRRLLTQNGERLRLDTSIKISRRNHDMVRVELTPLDSDPTLRTCILDSLMNLLNQDKKIARLVSRIMDMGFPILPNLPHPVYHSGLSICRKTGCIKRIKLYFRNRLTTGIRDNQALQILRIALPDINRDVGSSYMGRIQHIASASGMVFAFLGVDVNDHGNVSSVKFYFDCDVPSFVSKRLASIEDCIPVFRNPLDVSVAKDKKAESMSIRYAAVEFSGQTVSWKSYFR